VPLCPLRPTAAVSAGTLIGVSTIVSPSGLETGQSVSNADENTRIVEPTRSRRQGGTLFRLIDAGAYLAIKDLVVREPSRQAAETSPLYAPGQAIPSRPLDAREVWGYVFWGLLGAFILTTETLAAFWSGFPIPTLSWTTGQLEQHHHWFKLIVVGGLAIIATRVTFYPWPFKRLDD
jgi:hypothetical protein